MRGGDEGSGDIGAHDLQDRRLDVLVGESFDMAVVNWSEGMGTLFFPDLEGFAADAVKNGEESRLVSVFEHL